MPSSKKQSGKKVDWKQASQKGCSVRLLLGYAAPLLLTPAAVVNSDVNDVVPVAESAHSHVDSLLGTVPVPLAWLLPFFVLPLAGVTSISDLSHMFMEDSLVILLLGMNVLVAVGEETALCSRVALYVIEAFGLRLARHPAGHHGRHLPVGAAPDGRLRHAAHVRRRRGHHVRAAARHHRGNHRARQAKK
ncbi:hypothetical protein MRX96_052327, partial [Rhipicephalus microplus]